MGSRIWPSLGRPSQRSLVLLEFFPSACSEVIAKRFRFGLSKTKGAEPTLMLRSKQLS